MIPSEQMSQFASYMAHMDHNTMWDLEKIETFLNKEAERVGHFFSFKASQALVSRPVGGLSFALTSPLSNMVACDFTTLHSVTPSVIRGFESAGQ